VERITVKEDHLCNQIEKDQDIGDLGEDSVEQAQQKESKMKVEVELLWIVHMQHSYTADGNKRESFHNYF
jgi:uncharacterized protein YaaN involved in tellurite resistance